MRDSNGKGWQMCSGVMVTTAAAAPPDSDERDSEKDGARTMRQHAAPAVRSPKADPAGAEIDYRLAARCVSGEAAAWEELYAQCHDALCASIRVMLGRRRSDSDLIDEMAARVWYRLVNNDGELLARYSPRRGARLITFMRALAKDEICRNARNEVRRRGRELVAVQSRRQPVEVDLAVLGSDLRVFLETLTPQEHKFCREVLLGVSDNAEDALRTKTNVWQLTHRVYQKLLRFLGR